MRGSFMKLFDYISGGNSGKTKIPMTSPVVTKIEPGQGPNCESTFTMSFYNPYSYQVGYCSASTLPWAETRTSQLQRHMCIVRKLNSCTS